MKVAEFLKAQPKGAVITNKRVLSVLKRAGLIYDYDKWGVLESQWVYYISSYDGKPTKDITYAGKEIKAGELGSFENPFPSASACGEAGYGCTLWFEYEGVKLSSKYLSGCFSAYLEKVGGECATDKVVNPTMTLWGQVC